MLLGPVTCTLPPLNCAEFPLALAVGVRTIVIVAVEPACKVPTVQTTEVAEELPLHVPALVLAETNVTGQPAAVKSSVILMLVAGSGPLFVTV
jgi:hypothetical protein